MVIEYMVIYGYMWLYVVIIYGYIWLYVVIYGYIWVYVVLCGYIWLYVVIYMVLCGYVSEYDSILINIDHLICIISNMGGLLYLVIYYGYGGFVFQMELAQNKTNRCSTWSR